MLLGHRRSGSTERADYSHPAQGSIHSCLWALLPSPPGASLLPNSLHWPLPQCPACKPLCTKNAPVGCTWLWLIWIISKGSLQPKGAPGAGGGLLQSCAAADLQCAVWRSPLSIRNPETLHLRPILSLERGNSSLQK